ncbi:NAD(P)H-dependent oxidoreductase [Fulvivirga ulvae]|uniref:NAD(P)H-dependent oxidoreductase n=1 Tax=Fulvivirga ulvae TaxID=2904245 RepID=UPI001F383CF2|nr:NAD(P)H-dependent oxidoreductase [Fulvivirga ulvae]UII31464.1 NAD(P)H-dependent oxidoreductase [Fulvivirga ulvae]
MELLKQMEWRYATKKFDIHEKVSDDHIALLKRAIQLSVSSYGLQLYKVIIIKNEEVKQKLKSASWNQSQVSDASHLFVFCNYTDAKPENIDDFMRLTAEVRDIPLKKLQRYGDFINEKLSEKSPTELYYWLKSQTYIALANLLSACAVLKIDACPMEGFDAGQYNTMLGLTEKGLNASVIVAVGYRSSEDETQRLPKVRRPSELLFQSL